MLDTQLWLIVSDRRMVGYPRERERERATETGMEGWKNRWKDTQGSEKPTETCLDRWKEDGRKDGWMIHEPVGN